MFNISRVRLINSAICCLFVCSTFFLFNKVGPIALLGSGPDEELIHAAALERLGAHRVLLLPAHDHAKIHDLLSPDSSQTTSNENDVDDVTLSSDPTCRVAEPWSAFVNPSTSEVLCTATAEALAMGKTVIVPR